MIDIHNHSRFSFDSIASPENMVTTAFERGAIGFGFAEHIYLTDKSNYSEINNTMISYLKEIDILKKKFNNMIFSGVEFNYYKKFDQEYKLISNKYDFDYIINSVHWIDDVDIYKDFFKDKSIDDGFQMYLTEVLKSLDTIFDYQIVGHVGVLLKIYNNIPYNDFYNRYSTSIDKILKKIIEKGKCLEINTATSNGELCIPTLEVIERYYNLGGRKVSLGSDAHKNEKVMTNINKVVEEIKKIGFQYLTYYEKKMDRRGLG